MSDHSDTRPWIVLGCGRMGRMLGWLAPKHDIPLEATWNRTHSAADSLPETFDVRHRTWGSLDSALAPVDLEGAIVWVTVVDDALDAVAAELAPHTTDATLTVHTCGSRPASLLADAGIGGPVGSLHPLLAITDPQRAAERAGEVAWTVEGDASAVAYARSLIEARLGARLVELDAGRRALYHASASTAANLLVGLLEATFEMAEAAGLDRDEAREMLMPLVDSSVDNASTQPLEEALSGPLARGDEATVARHLDALERLDEERLADVYRTLTDWTRRRLGEGDAED